MLKIGFGMTAVAAAGSWAYLRHIMLPVGPDRMEWSQEVFAHRGCRFVTGVPENTRRAFEYAVANCASGIECDVRMCKSGDLVVFHDAVLGPHVRNQELAKTHVHELTLTELQNLELTDDTTGRGDRICTLADAIEVARNHDVKILIELKPTPKATRAQQKAYVDAVLKKFAEHPDFLYDRAMVISFNPMLLYALRRRDPRIAVVQLSRPDLVTFVVAAGGEKASLPMWARLVPSRFADRIIHFALYSVAPWVIGASGVGVPYTSYSDLEVHRWNHRRMFFYLWGFPNVESCNASMRSPGVMIAADDDFGRYFLKRRYPRQ